MTTKKVGSAGRFGVRYGVGIRKKLIKAEKEQKKVVACPSCSFLKVKRKAAGLFECKKCGCVFAGGAYTSETLAGKSIKKIVSQKTFGVESEKELETIESPLKKIEEKVEKSIKG